MAIGTITGLPSILKFKATPTGRPSVLFKKL